MGRRGPKPQIGSSYVDTEGYVVERVAQDWPYIPEVWRQDRRWFRQHRVVMSEHLGRALRANESIHHINGDKTDNRVENLQLRNGSHGAGQALRCRSCGSHDLEPYDLS